MSSHVNRTLPALEISRAISSDTPLSRQIIPSDDKHPCVMAVVMVASQFISGEAQCNAEGMAIVGALYRNLVQAAELGGFKDADVLHMYVKRNRWRETSFDLLDDMIACVGGPDACLDIIDLTNFKQSQELPQ